MSAKDLIIQFDEFQARRVERCAKMFDLTPEDLCEFAIVKTTDDIERLEAIVRDPDLKAQLRDVCDLRKLGKLDAADFEREVLELLSMRDDAGWDSEA